MATSPPSRAPWPTRVLHPAQGKRLKAELKRAFEASPFDVQRVLDVAEKVGKAFELYAPERFGTWLASAIGSLVFDPARARTLSALADLLASGALILTTNYDSLLTQITHAPPVPWTDLSEFLRVIKRKRLGILHIHGHWGTPESIILGRSSYQALVDSDDAQLLFKNLWLNCSWLYVGCGNGLDDPNFSQLLRWGAKFGGANETHYFLSRRDRVEALSARADKPYAG